MVAAVEQMLQTCHRQRKIVQQHHTVEVGHLLCIEVFPHHIAHKQHARFGVIHNTMYIVGLELVQDRHCHGAVGQCSQKSHTPMRTVAAAQSHFVALFQTALFVHQVYFCNLTGNLFVLQRNAFVVSQCVEFPIFLN